MAQAFRASTGFELLGHEREGLVATDAWLAGFLERSELKPPADAGAHELALYALVAANARASVAPSTLSRRRSRATSWTEPRTRGSAAPGRCSSGASA